MFLPVSGRWSAPWLKAPPEATASSACVFAVAPGDGPPVRLPREEAGRVLVPGGLLVESVSLTAPPPRPVGPPVPPAGEALPPTPAVQPRRPAGRLGYCRSPRSLLWRRRRSALTRLCSVSPESQRREKEGAGGGVPAEADGSGETHMEALGRICRTHLRYLHLELEAFPGTRFLWSSSCFRELPSLRFSFHRAATPVWAGGNQSFRWRKRFPWDYGDFLPRQTDSSGPNTRRQIAASPLRGDKLMQKRCFYSALTLLLLLFLLSSSSQAVQRGAGTRFPLNKRNNLVYYLIFCTFFMFFFMVATYTQATYMIQYSWRYDMVVVSTHDHQGAL